MFATFASSQDTTGSPAGLRVVSSQQDSGTPRGLTEGAITGALYVWLPDGQHHTVSHHLESGRSAIVDLFLRHFGLDASRG